MITIKDIAKTAGVSYASVSRALNNQMSEGNPAKEYIQKIAKEMGYEKNTLASGLVTRKTNTIGFVLPDLSNPFFTNILSSINRIADMNGYLLLICNTGWDREKEKKELKALSEKRVDGILLYPSVDIYDDQFYNSDIPMVIFGKTISKRASGTSFVEVDNVQGGKLAVNHMIQCGYKHLAFLGGPGYSSSNAARLESFCEVQKAAGIEICTDLISEESYTINSGYERTKKLMKLPKSHRPDGLVCADDLIALGAMQAISEAGFGIPDDVGIVGFDDVAYASLPQIQLTTVKIPCSEMGEAGMQLLMLSMDSMQKKSSKTGRIITLNTKLIVRQTTRNVTLTKSADCESAQKENGK